MAPAGGLRGTIGRGLRGGGRALLGQVTPGGAQQPMLDSNGIPMGGQSMPGGAAAQMDSPAAGGAGDMSLSSITQQQPDNGRPTLTEMVMNDQSAADVGSTSPEAGIGGLGR